MFLARRENHKNVSGLLINVMHIYLKKIKNCKINSKSSAVYEFEYTSHTTTISQEL